jgi:UPF0755 protein
MRILPGKYKFLLAAFVLLALLTGGLFIAYGSLFGAPQKAAEVELFTTPVSAVDLEGVIKRLKDGGFIRSTWAFNLALSRRSQEIESGGYRISKSMDVWELAQTLTSTPSLKWVVIPEGLRKEEIANKLAETLGWTEEQKEDWIYKYTAMEYDYLEGVYFPDTYLIPVDESGLDVANRLRRHFDEKFAPYMTGFLKQNVKWTTALKIASIVQREAAGKGDMSLIAGILWNRLLEEMKLEVDATVQYARDDRDSLTAGFWKPIKPEDKEIDSKYNTYKYPGLPPFPIANPGLDAIDAVLNPAETDCFYYLHDSNKQIHCAKTYQEHLANIDEYLK